MPPGMVRRGLSVLVAVPAPVLLLLLAAGWPSYGLAWASSPYPTFTCNDTLFEHMTLHPDPAVGRVYVGAQDRLFQLDRHLTAELQFDTGPVTDSRECLPPVTEGNCPQARPTSNHNKLLLVDPYSMELITCGSVNQGICQKRSLDSVGTVLFSAERPVDTQYVAANHPNVSTVGLVVRSRPDRQPVLFVGRGYTSSHPPISTRNLVQEPVFSYEETAKLSVAGRLSEYDHHFVASFAQRQHVYFLFYRRDLKSQSREYRTYVSRVCLDDQAYYSYVEVPLACRSAAGKSYNLLQAVRLGLPPRGSGGEAGKAEVLLGVFSTHQTSSTRPSEDSALCMFNLDDLDQRINSTRDLCYTQFGRAEGGGEAAYIEYEVKSNCANLPSNTLDAYPCGSDHTPSPMASRVAVEAEPILDSPSTRLTAVAVSVRAGHTIAFLGDSKGNLRKVFLGPNGEVEEYAVVSIQANTAISSDLLLDQSEEHLFIMTSTMLQKRPVAECHEHLDCQACLSAHDPYCGWCVLEGRCGQQAQCSRGAQAGQWLWSFDMEQKCLTIQSLSPSNISRQEKRSISLSVLGLAVLEEDKSYSCFFHDSESPATVTDMGVTCLSPDPHRVLTGPPGQDFVTVTLSLRFGNVVVTATEFTFYDCTAAKQLSGSVPCLYNSLFLSLPVTLYNCSVGRSDCSQCHTADQKYGCVWCGGDQSTCLYGDSCSEPLEQTCPAPVIHAIEPLSGLVEGGTVLTISGSNLGQKAEDILHSVTVAGVSCSVIPHLYEVSSRIVCKTKASGGEKTGQVSVEVSGGEFGLSSQRFSYQDPFVMEVSPQRGPKAGGTSLTITGRNLLTGRPSDITVTVGGVQCVILSEAQDDSVVCVTGSSNRTGDHRVTLHYGNSQRHLHESAYSFTPNPNITQAAPAKSFLSGGRLIFVSGHNLDVVQQPNMLVTVFPWESIPQRRRRRSGGEREHETEDKVLWRHRRIVPEPNCPGDPVCSIIQYMERCEVNSSTLILCRSPALEPSVWGSQVDVAFLLDNLRFPFGAISPQGAFSYEPNPVLHPLNQQEPLKPYRYNPGSFIQLEGENLDLAISKEEVVVLVGEGVCAVKTLTRNHLYCEPPPQQPFPGPPNGGRKREGADTLPEFTVHMGNLNFSLGMVQYDILSLSTFPLEAQVGVGVGASILALIVLIIVLIYRRKSKQALRDYKKVQIQLENLETSVRDRCKKEFTDLMTEMMDMSSDLVGSGIPFLDYRRYAERIFFPGHRESPLRRDLDVQESRRATVEQGLVQLSNLLNSKLFLTKFIHTLESQRTFSPRDRAYVASLLTVALHGKLEYFTDILKTLLNDLVEQYVVKNPKLMLRRTETVVEKLLTNWMSISLYAFLRDSAGESLYMLFRAIKHQVDKGPVDAVTGKAKYTLNDNRLLREDVEYKTLTLNVLMQGGGVNETQPLPSKVLDIDTITQVKEKLLDQVYKGTSFSHRPHTDSLDLEWRSGVAGHLILSDEDLTSIVQGNWKRLNTLQHYKVADGATVALVPRHSKHIHHDNHDYVAGEKTPMLEDADEGGVRLWHLVKAGEEPELPKHRRGSVRERAKAIPEIYLTRLLSMKGTLQKFVDDLFTVILSTSRPVPLAVKYFFDLLDDQAQHHAITDPETIHIWKTNSLPLRFWINIVKNPQFIFDVQPSDHVDAVLTVISQTFMDSCTTSEHKLGRDSPINKLLYARDIPRYKQMVERYYADIRQTISASDQEMNSALAELSRNYSGELNYLVALHELYKYINKYYDQIIGALEEDSTAQKMQLGYRLQQIAAAVENKVTDL
ncbi:plexin-B1 [Oncorhynchus kisutch]|uniref:plexin-B1 n=1 Tax=Oncorhynchus kisutch TaxID=8019 RepID=UPI0012DE8C7A|nr:plexin-B1 [Oncorhynchus kisutch]